MFIEIIFIDKEKSVNDDAFFSILQMNQIIISNQDKNELIRFCRV